MSARVRLIVGPALVVTLSASLGVAACTTDYQKGADDPNYGAPNALAGQKQPGPTSELIPQEGGGASGGGGVACVQKGGTMVPAGTCAVSFKTDVLGALGGASPQCSVSSCHGGASPPNQPTIDTAAANAPSTWSAFAAFKMSNGTLYINPCSTDKAQSGIACNLYATGGCGTHMPLGGQLPADAITKIETWVACGAPNN